MAAPKWDIKDTERDVLRARFTLWLDTILARASAKCRAQMNDKFSENMEIVSMDAFPADYFPDPIIHIQMLKLEHQILTSQRNA